MPPIATGGVTFNRNSPLLLAVKFTPPEAGPIPKFMEKVAELPINRSSGLLLIEGEIVDAPVYAGSGSR